jgi:hypothetical protein
MHNTFLIILNGGNLIPIAFIFLVQLKNKYAMVNADTT